jgi:hypothetical protein
LRFNVANFSGAHVVRPTSSQTIQGRVYRITSGVFRQDDPSAYTLAPVTTPLHIADNCVVIADFLPGSEDVTQAPNRAPVLDAVLAVKTLLASGSSVFGDKTYTGVHFSMVRNPITGEYVGTFSPGPVVWGQPRG